MYRRTEEKAEAQQNHLPVWSAPQDMTQHSLMINTHQACQHLLASKKCTGYFCLLKVSHRMSGFRQLLTMNVGHQVAFTKQHASPRPQVRFIKIAKALKKDTEVTQLSRVSVVTVAPAALESNSWSSFHELQRLNLGSPSRKASNCLFQEHAFVHQNYAVKNVPGSFTAALLLLRRTLLFLLVPVVLSAPNSPLQAHSVVKQCSTWWSAPCSAFTSMTMPADV